MENLGRHGKVFFAELCEKGFTILDIRTFSIPAPGSKKPFKPHSVIAVHTSKKLLLHVQTYVDPGDRSESIYSVDIYGALQLRSNSTLNRLLHTVKFSELTFGNSDVFEFCVSVKDAVHEVIELLEQHVEFVDWPNRQRRMTIYPYGGTFSVEQNERFAAWRKQELRSKYPNETAFMNCRPT